LADSPRTILQTLTETILEITQCDSAGLSLLTVDGKTPDAGGQRFYWPAIAGTWNPHVGGGTPRNFGPCGDVLDQNRTLLFRHFERRYPYLLPVIPAAEECLLVPFYVAGKAVGTIWAIMHSDRRKFDAEDDRVMASLGKFASSAYQTLATIDELRFQIGEPQQPETAVRVNLCPKCGRPLTQLGPDGECLRCVFDWAFTSEREGSEGLTGTGAEPRALYYGHFEIEMDAQGAPLVLGAGAMAVTYRARDTILNSTVALKVISNKLAENPSARARFLREARAAAQIQHPNVARVIHYGEQDGECFYAMQLVRGETLEARVQRDGPLSLPLALEVIQQTARGLAAAEVCGVVHRDIKPSNLMIESAASGDELVKIIDYGVAKVVASDSTAQTQAGFIGTPAFASPEQFDEAGQQQIDARSDIYSLGVTFWYLLTGHTPFAGRTLEEIRAKQTKNLPLQRLKRAHVPPRVISLLSSMLAIDAAKRPQSARELLGALHRCYVRFEPQARIRRKRLVLATATSILVILGIAFLTFLYQHVRSAAEVERSIAVLPFENLSPGNQSTFFTVGMQEEITANLARLADMKVIGAQSTRSYLPDKNRNLPAIAHELGVQHLLEGAVWRDNGRVRLSLRLVDTRDPNHPWIETYERPVSDVFAMRSEITRAVAGRLRTQLTPNEKSVVNDAPTKDPEAYDLYLRAREGPVSFRDESSVRREMQRKIDLLNKAVARDPQFLLAYCELAKAHGRFFISQIGAKPEELLVDHRSLAEIALQNARRIDADAGELHLAQAYYFFSVTKDYEQAGAEAELARRTLPNNAELDLIAARVARGQGRWEDAVRFFKRAVEVEPRGNDNRFSLAETYRYMRRYADYDHLVSEIISGDPAHPGDLPLERAVGLLDQRGDPRPLRAAMVERAAANDLTEHDKVLCQLTLAWCDRDPEAIRRTLEATDLNKITNSGFAYPKAWFEALAARIRRDDVAAKRAFAAARGDVENEVLANPGNGRMLGLLAMIDAGLGNRQAAVDEALRAREQLKNSATDAPIADCNLAIVYAWTGQPDLAFAVLEPLVNKPAGRNMPDQPTYGDFQLNPVWDPLRSDARFQSLVQRLSPSTSKH
jgi:serine/threonine protein kinase/tetratricopeptide (TPR) repeat protein